ncbi:MAG: type II toxin-antitoxin system HicA family toxin [Verrucomicrobia bacterium]|nr:type II toxin-antitoxin system HicA family toxin [Verrucomicrobiota bacterium]
MPGISRATAVRVFSKLGFRIAHKGKHTVMSNGRVRLTIPRHNSTRHNSINAFTMADIAKDAGLAPEQFRELM